MSRYARAEKNLALLAQKQHGAAARVSPEFASTDQGCSSNEMSPTSTASPWLRRNAPSSTFPAV